MRIVQLSELPQKGKLPTSLQLSSQKISSCIIYPHNLQLGCASISLSLTHILPQVGLQCVGLLFPGVTESCKQKTPSIICFAD